MPSNVDVKSEYIGDLDIASRRLISRELDMNLCLTFKKLNRRTGIMNTNHGIDTHTNTIDDIQKRKHWMKSKRVTGRASSV